ncbi:MAG TPA: hypothetical protein VK671_05430 [Mucilaginibacter sp.]|nr:hypothetical protein [Mucilaginibacter sp.]
MSKRSAGILLYRFLGNQLQVFLIHPGGPFFRNKDVGGWSIPKGEFMEETGQKITGNFIPLTPILQKGGKTVYAWAVEGDIDHETIVSNLFEMEWPPRSGKKQTFPEVDKADWFDMETAKIKINQAQIDLINELESKIIPKK